MSEPNATVIERLDVAPGLLKLRVAPLGWELPSFLPGQFAILGLPASTPKSPGSQVDEPILPANTLIRRAFTIASSSMEHHYLDFYLAETKSGAFTPRIFMLKVGQTLWLDPTFTNMFTLDGVPPESHVAFIATGTGLAPHLATLRTRLERGASRKIAVIQGASHSWDLVFRHELFQMQCRVPNFHYLPVLTQPRTELAPWKGGTGRLQNFWKDRPLDQLWGFRPSPSNAHVLLCGHPAMVESMLAVLKDDGFQEHTQGTNGQVHLERFW